MRNIYTKWKNMAEKIGNFQSGMVFSVFYFILITPVGLTASIFTDFLNRKRSPSWLKVDRDMLDIEDLKSQ